MPFSSDPPGSNAPDAAALAPARAIALPAAAAALAARLAFREALDLVHACNSALPEVEARLGTLRARGYAWRHDLETSLAQARSHAAGALSAAQAAVFSAAHALGARVGAFQERVHQVCAGDPHAHAADLAALVDEQRALEEALRDADRQIEAAGAALVKPTQAVSAAIMDLLWALDQVAEATFQLEVAERLVAVLRATWADPPDRLDKQGLLVLSDLRLRFEQKEVFVTQRQKPGFAVDHKAVHQLLIDEPQAAVAGAADHSSGWVATTQAIAVTFGADAKAPHAVTLTLTGTQTGAEIAALLNALRAGDHALLG